MANRFELDVDATVEDRDKPANGPNEDEVDDDEADEDDDANAVGAIVMVELREVARVLEVEEELLEVVADVVEVEVEVEVDEGAGAAAAEAAASSDERAAACGCGRSNNDTGASALPVLRVKANRRANNCGRWAFGTCGNELACARQCVSERVSERRV